MQYVGLPALETHLKDRSNHFEVHLELKNKLDLPGFVSTVRALGIRIDDIESNPAYLNSGLSVFTVSFTVSSAELKQYKSTVRSSRRCGRWITYIISKK